MKRFDIFYYIFIFGSMALSAIQASAMFIKQNALAGWLWMVVFLAFMFFIFFEAIERATAMRLTETQKERLMVQVINIIGLDFARKCLFELEHSETNTTIDEARRNHFRR